MELRRWRVPLPGDWGYQRPHHVHFDRLEVKMPEPLAPKNVPPIIGQAFDHLNTYLTELNRSPEQRFRDLQLEPGDRIRLTEVAGPMVGGRRAKAPDAAVIEGVILGIKEKHGGPQVRIKGFDHTGGRAGGQHIWLPVGDYHIEVLHKTVRLTTLDKVIAELAGMTEDEYRRASDDRRISLRQTYVKRAQRIVHLLSL